MATNNHEIDRHLVIQKIATITFLLVLTSLKVADRFTQFVVSFSLLLEPISEPREDRRNRESSESLERPTSF